MKHKTALPFLILALLTLLLGMIFGILSGFQYIVPDFLKKFIPFSSMRPLHVTSVVSWIILAATGGIYYYLSNENPRAFSKQLAKWHFLLFLLVGVSIYCCYFAGILGGKEYLEFPPVVILPVLLGWLLFARQYFKSLKESFKSWAVYHWMWATGIVLMVVHLSESYLWMMPGLEQDFIKTLAVQWKSGGSYVGAWNMLVYGTAIFLMSKLKNDDRIGRSREAFFFYFLGLTNLMFGWAHHIYIVPTAAWVRYLSYAISMTEWVVLFHLLYTWQKSALTDANTKMPLMWLRAADWWIALNLALVLLLSIPAVNLFTHGTHITVAHSMGSTIGINTTIMMASVCYIAQKINPKLTLPRRDFLWGYRLFNGSLLVFWLCLLALGVRRSHWMFYGMQSPFSSLHSSSHEIHATLLLSGLGIFIGLAFFAFPLLKTFLKAWRAK